MGDCESLCGGLREFVWGTVRVCVGDCESLWVTVRVCVGTVRVSEGL